MDRFACLRVRRRFSRLRRLASAAPDLLRASWAADIRGPADAPRSVARRKRGLSWGRRETPLGQEREAAESELWRQEAERSGGAGGQL